jgi:AraC-like DNA-binding protein
MKKNNVQLLEIETDFLLMINENISDEIIKVTKKVKNTFIQVHYCLDKSSKLFFNNHHYAIDLVSSKSLLLYNPKQELPIDIELLPGAKLVSILISIEKLHSFFTQEYSFIGFNHGDKKDKKVYSDKPISASESIVLSQLISYKVQPVMEKLYIKAKIYELLSLYFQPGTHESAPCPYLEDEDNVEKIRKAKRIIIERMSEPPTLSELADEVGLQLVYLKDGFKQIYGDTVFNFLWEYKMEYARRMLDSKKYNVSEVSFKVGYSTASHFIAAFKKKFGITPKKYMGNLR